MSLTSYCHFDFCGFLYIPFSEQSLDHLWLELVSDSQTTGVPGFRLHKPSFLGKSA